MRMIPNLAVLLLAGFPSLAFSIECDKVYHYRMEPVFNGVVKVHLKTDSDGSCIIEQIDQLDWLVNPDSDYIARPISVRTSTASSLIARFEFIESSSGRSVYLVVMPLGEAGICWRTPSWPADWRLKPTEYPVGDLVGLAQQGKIKNCEVQGGRTCQYYILANGRGFPRGTGCSEGQYYEKEGCDLARARDVANCQLQLAINRGVCFSSP